MSGFPAEFTKHYFVAAYLYANKSTKYGPAGFDQDLCFDVQRLFVLVKFVIRLAIGV